MKGKGVLIAVLVAVALLALPAPQRAGGWDRTHRSARQRRKRGADERRRAPIPTRSRSRRALNRKAPQPGPEGSGPGGRGTAWRRNRRRQPQERRIDAARRGGRPAVAQCSEQQLAKQACPPRARSATSPSILHLPWSTPRVRSLFSTSRRPRRRSPVRLVSPSPCRLYRAPHRQCSRWRGLWDLGVGAWSAAGSGRGWLDDDVVGRPVGRKPLPPAVPRGPCVPVPAGEQPFLTLPTSCPSELTASVREGLTLGARRIMAGTGDLDPDHLLAPLQAMTGCDRLSFTPSLERAPKPRSRIRPPA